MAIERLIIALVVALIVWTIIRHAIAPAIVWLLRPFTESVRARHRRAVAESLLRVAKEDANVVRIEAEIASVSDDVIDSLTEIEKGKESKHE